MDLTYILPCRIESEDRLRNVITSVSYLLRKIPESKVIVKEVSPDPVFKSQALPEIQKYCDTSNLKFSYEKINEKELFHKTKILNDLIFEADTNVICSHDVDVIYPVTSHIRAYEAIKNNECDVMYPYGCGVWQYQVDYPQEVFSKFISDFDMEVIKPTSKTQSSSIGWTQFYDKNAVIKGGMWNENFLSWGAEDCEFYFRFCALGFRVGRIDNWIWHFEHMRTHNSHYHNPKFIDNHNYWQWLRNQNKETLTQHYQSQEYIKRRFKDAGF
jgi:hypothetical protein